VLITDTDVAIDSVRSRWRNDARAGPGVTQVATALDNANDRIEVAAALPHRVYNDWTQPADLG